MKLKHTKAVFIVLAALFVMSAVQAYAAKDTLTVINQIDAGSLDPLSTRDIAASTICSHIYDNLVKLDTQNNILPGLAESWEETTPTEITFACVKTPSSITAKNSTPTTLNSLWIVR